MEPIISPWIIYLIDLINKAWGCALIMLVVSPVYFLIVWLGNTDKHFVSEEENLKKLFKYGVYAVVVALIIVIVLPSKDTMIAMLVSSYVTPDNITLVQDNLVDFVKRIMDVVHNT